jgi:hypothetical protein
MPLYKDENEQKQNGSRIDPDSLAGRLIRRHECCALFSFQSEIIKRLLHQQGVAIAAPTALAEPDTAEPTVQYAGWSPSEDEEVDLLIAQLRDASGEVVKLPDGREAALVGDVLIVGRHLDTPTEGDGERDATEIEYISPVSEDIRQAIDTESLRAVFDLARRPNAASFISTRRYEGALTANDADEG